MSGKRIMTPPPEYKAWSHADLVDRVARLESQLSHTQAMLYGAQHKASRPQKQRATDGSRKMFDPSKYHTRYIALKLAYLGQAYNGFEHHANNRTRLPTIEEALWRALAKAKLIFKDSSDQNGIDWEGCEYTKCGRTDKGVSAFGQVIGLRVRSARPKRNQEQVTVDLGSNDQDEEIPPSQDQFTVEAEKKLEQEIPFDEIHDEIPYVRVLNRCLPSDIRVLAWCPSLPPDFSARFSCRERRYRYFFTQPCFTPLPGPGGVFDRHAGEPEREGWLDIGAMQQASTYFMGTQDFRNFCKLDQSKQITNFQRIIRKVEVHPVHPEDSLALAYLEDHALGGLGGSGQHQNPQVFYFEVHGSAFLWHQVRHMVAILFLVGQRFERPTIVKELLDVKANPCKPVYEMADDAPLVLWDCIFPNPDGPANIDSLRWIYPDDHIDVRSSTQLFSSVGDGRYGTAGINEVLWEHWRQAKMSEILSRSLLDVVASQRSTNDSTQGFYDLEPNISRLPQTRRLFDGGPTPRSKGPYVPVLERERMKAPEAANREWLLRKGFSNSQTSSVKVDD